MFFPTKKGNQNNDAPFSLNCGDNNIEFVEETKLLRVIFDYKH